MAQRVNSAALLAAAKEKKTKVFFFLLFIIIEFSVYFLYSDECSVYTLQISYTQYVRGHYIPLCAACTHTRLIARSPHHTAAPHTHAISMAV